MTAIDDSMLKYVEIDLEPFKAGKPTLDLTEDEAKVLGDTFNVSPFLYLLRRSRKKQDKKC